MSSIAIITARGGSKRIPRKNIKEFCGKPIIAYSIEAALNSGAFDEVMVSTDDDEIAEIAKKFGAKVPFMRSAETSNDFATTRDVLEEVLSEYESHGKKYDYVCCIYPTAPLVTSDRLKEGLEMLIENQADEVEPVVKFSYPPQRGWKINDNNGLEYCYPEYQNSRSQDLEPIYHDAGQFYWYNYKTYFVEKKQNCFICPLVLSELEVQDIDDLSDWKIAELKYMMNTNK